MSNVSFLAWKSRLFAMGLSPSTEAKHVQRLRVRSLQAGSSVENNARSKYKGLVTSQDLLPSPYI